MCVCVCVKCASELNSQPLVGGDGGTKATGRKYLRGAKAAATGDAEKSAKTEAKKEQAVALLSKSALSGSRLEAPVVADATGRLFNKDEVVMGILDKSLKKNAEFSHIRSLKDVVECVLTANPAYKQRGKAKALDGESAVRGPAKWMCPLTQAAMDGGQAFCVVRETGAVISQRALRSIPRAALREALGVSDSFSTSLDVAAAGSDADVMDLIVLGMGAEARAVVRAAAVARRKAKKALKKGKKVDEATLVQVAPGAGGAIVNGKGQAGAIAAALTGAAGAAGTKRKRQEMGNRAIAKRARGAEAPPSSGAVAAMAAVVSTATVDAAAAGAHAARSKSAVYSSLFNTKEKEADAKKTQRQRNDELFMHGNTRGTVRC